jgi:hypothetical protein
MVESRRQAQSSDPFDRFDEAISDPRLYEAPRYEAPRYEVPRYEVPRYEAPRYEDPPYEPSSYALQPYERPESEQDDQLSQEPVPLFLSNYEDEPYDQLPGYTFASGSKTKSNSFRVVTGVVAVAAIGAVLALFSIDSTRAVIFSASFGDAAPAPAQFGTAQPEPPQRVAVAAQPPKVEAPAPAEALAARRTPPSGLSSASPTRDEIAAAYQSAIKSNTVVAPEPVVREAAREAAPVPAPVIREAAPPKRIEAAPARRIDPDELAALLKRAKGLLGIGDITSARLLLERAADAQEAEAALMLAGTYDPQVLGSQDLRSVTPDPAAARLWYQKAAQLGSPDAKRRLGQLQ